MTHESNIQTSTGDVFRDLGFDSNEAQDLRLRSDLMIALRERIAARNEPQTQIAALLGVSQPRVSDLLRGKIHLFSLDTLVTMLARLGATVDVSVRVPAMAQSAVSEIPDTHTSSFITTVVGLGGLSSAFAALCLPVATIEISVAPTENVITQVVLDTGCFALTEHASAVAPVGRVDHSNTQFALAA